MQVPRLGFSRERLNPLLSQFALVLHSMAVGCHSRSLATHRLPNQLQHSAPAWHSFHLLLDGNVVSAVGGKCGARN